MNTVIGDLRHAARELLRLCVVFDKLASEWVTESSRDPAILGGVTALLMAVAAIACLAPARRAASIDPMEALRHQ